MAWKGRQGEQLRGGGKWGGPLGVWRLWGLFSMSEGLEFQGEPPSLTRALSSSPGPHTDCAYVPALHPCP